MFERTAPEQHDTLPDILEPSENPRLFGHEEQAALLAGAYRAGKLHHALLFAGPQGVGKATFAFHLAHHILKHPDGASAPDSMEKPDPASPLFRLIAQNAHPSVLHLTRPLNRDGKSFKAVLTVDEIRRVARFLSLTSHDGGYRVIVIDAADDMNVSAANALLKSLEEPPARSLFILIAHQPGRLLPTIRSRCQLIRFSPLESETLAAILENFEAGVPEDPAARAALAKRAGGSARAAVLLTQYGGLELAEAASRIVHAPSLDIAQAHRLADAVSGRDHAIQFRILNRHFLDAISSAAADAALSGDAAGADRLSQLWQDANAEIIDTETYNLDKKQHVLGLLHRMQAALGR